MVPKRKKALKAKEINARRRAKKREVKYAAILSLAVLLAIAAYAIAYSVVNAGGPSFYGDDTVYLSLANSAVSGNFQESAFIFSVRILQILPIALFYKLFGIGMLSSSAWDILSFVGTIIAVFFIGKELYSRNAGMVSALLMAFFPLVVRLSATVSDDIPMMFLASLAILALVYATKKSSKQWYFLLGVFLVASPLVTPEGAIISVVVILYFVIALLRRRTSVNRTTLYFIYGILAAGIALMLFNYAYSYSRNPLITLTVSSHFYSGVGGQNTIPSTNTNPSFYISTMFPYGLANMLKNILNSRTLNMGQIWNQISMQGGNRAGFYFYFAVFAALYLLAKRERASYVPLLWLSVGFLYLEFGPMSISLFPFHYLLSYRLGRFLTIIAPAAVLTIGIAIARATECGSAFKSLFADAVSIAAILFLITTSMPINAFWHAGLVYARYSQMQIANYLNALPNTTKIYYTGSFALVPIYMKFDNLSRFYAYDALRSCSEIPAGAYVIIPYQEQFGINFTANPTEYCPSWQLVMAPLLSGYPPDITAPAMTFEAKLYHVPSNGTTLSNSTKTGANSSLISANSVTANEINFFNLTGIGVENKSSGKIEQFIVVNNVTSVSIALNRSQAGVGENVTLNVTFAGTFLWGTDAGKIYLQEPLINVHYYGIELSNQSGSLYDQSNGPWDFYINQTAAPHQVLYNNQYEYLRVVWKVAPKETAAGKTLKFCGGYFAAYMGNSSTSEWASLYNTFSYKQQRAINNTFINIPSGNCAYLNVT